MNFLHLITRWNTINTSFYKNRGRKREKKKKKIQQNYDRTHPTPKIPFGTAVWVKLQIVS